MTVVERFSVRKAILHTASIRALALLAALTLAACTGEAGSGDCALFCESWYDCSTTSAVDPRSHSCSFPSHTREQFRDLCEPKCAVAAEMLTSQERSDAVACLHCLLGQVAPLECTHDAVAEAVYGPCTDVCALPGPHAMLDAMFADPEISAACR